MTLRHASLLLSLSLIALLAPPASAGELSINGVVIGKVELSVQGLEGVAFEKCGSLKVVQGGDVHVDCPGYDLQAVSPPPPDAAAPAAAPANVITKRYWLVSEQTDRGATEFDIDIYVNAKWVKRIKSDDEQLVMELTKHLQPGENKVLFAATKNVKGERRSVSPNATFRVLIGEGDEGGGNVMISKPLVSVLRNAAEAENVTEERAFVAR